MKSRARALGRGAVKGIGGTAMGMGVGAVGYAAHGLSSKLTAPNGDMSKYPTRFWIPGAALAIAGHIMRRKPKLHDMGCALTGAAGFSLAEGATLAYSIKQNATAQTSAGTQGLAPGMYNETGAVFSANEDVGALVSAQESVGNLQDQEEMALMGL
jgi:hypothetical protein